mmetsp:Transcript_40895/g.36272  ORF Transcript_40895/g.36272 Transcript_40895/m.36272 type:complete len:105 (+) Transcript_40895:272-586(+)
MLRRISSTELCKIHFKEIEYVCINDKKVLCRDCLFYEKHSEHEKLTLKEANEKAEEVGALLQKINEKMNIDLGHINKLIESKRAEILGSFTQRFTLLIQAIQIH